MGALSLVTLLTATWVCPPPLPDGPTAPSTVRIDLPGVANFLDPEPAELQEPAPADQKPGVFEEVGDTLWILGKTFVLDMGYLVTAPLRPTKDGLFTFVGGAALIGVTMAVLDEPIRGFAQRNRHEGLDDFLGTVQAATSKPVATGIGLTALGLLFQDPTAERTGLEIVETDMVTELLTSVGKRVFGRSRPSAGRGPHSFKFMGGTTEDRKSFPSDAASNAFSIAVPIAEEYPGTVWPYVAYGVASLTGLQRITSDAHWASDVLTSALLSLAVGKALVWLHHQGGYPPLVPWLAAADDGRAIGLALETKF